MDNTYTKAIGIILGARYYLLNFAIKVSMVNFGESMPVEKRTTLVTGKGQVYFVNKLLAEAGRTA